MKWLKQKNRMEELKQYFEAGNYEAAAKIADTIPNSRVKTTSEFVLMAKTYKKNGDFLQAKDLYKKALEKRMSRTVLLELMDCCLETKELEEANRYFDEYHKLEPEDMATLYAYRYRIEKCKGREYHLLIAILEELKAIDYTEEYAYELAKMYHKAGMTEECMEECKEIILWFGEGVIVERAKALLAYYKGEISLEDIKTAGERYTAGQQAEQQTENAPDAKEEPESEGETEDTAPEETEDEFLPEIDLSCIDFTEEEEQNVRESYELYEPEETAPAEVKKAKVAEILTEKGISIDEICKNFARISDVRRQIVNSLDQVLSERGKVFLVITGEDKTGKTTLALTMVKLLYCMGIVHYDRTAVIDAKKLNEISIADRRSEIENCNLIIEHAGSVQEETLTELLHVLEELKNNTCVILEDSAKHINKFLRGKEELNQRFNNRIHLAKYSADDLMGFAFDYIISMDYGIDKMAAEVLRGKIDDIVKTMADEKRLVSTMELVKRAHEKAEARNSQAILKMAAAGQFKAGNFLVLLAEDFEVTP